MKFLKLFCLVLILSLMNHCGSTSVNEKESSKIQAEPVILYSWIDQTRVRDVPDLKASALTNLDEGEGVIWYGEKSNNMESLTLRGERYNTPFYKVKIGNKHYAWVYAGALKPIEEDKESPRKVPAYIVFENILTGNRDTYFSNKDVALKMMNNYFIDRTYRLPEIFIKHLPFEHSYLFRYTVELLHRGKVIRSQPGELKHHGNYPPENDETIEYKFDSIAPLRLQDKGIYPVRFNFEIWLNRSEQNELKKPDAVSSVMFNIYWGINLKMVKAGENYRYLPDKDTKFYWVKKEPSVPVLMSPQEGTIPFFNLEFGTKVIIIKRINQRQGEGTKEIPYYYIETLYKKRGYIRSADLTNNYYSISR